MGNAERNSFVKNKITTATLALLKKKELSDISISEIITTAEVSRNSFYRNYTEKEDIIHDHLYKLYTSWDNEVHSHGEIDNTQLYASLFKHLKDNSDFYLLLKQRGLFHLFLNILIEKNGAKPEDDNLWAYIKSFITYGTYGWIETWIARGMQESAESMAALLSSQGKN